MDYLFLFFLLIVYVTKSVFASSFIFETQMSFLSNVVCYQMAWRQNGKIMPQLVTCIQVIGCFALFIFFALCFYAVSRIALVKPEKARGVEDVILRAAQMGQIVEKVQQYIVSISLAQLLHLYLLQNMANNSMNETTDFTISFQVSEERLITLLEQINNQTTKQTKVTVSIHCLLHRYLLKYGMLSSVPNDLRIYSLIFRYKGVEAFLRMTISK